MSKTKKVFKTKEVFKTKDFPKTDLQELSCMDAGESYEDWECIENDIIDSSRWSIHYRQVFKYKGILYETSYSRAATEHQDECPYEYENDMITCYEVEPYEVTVTKYRKIQE